MNTREFLSLAYGRTEEFLRRINEPEVFRVTSFYPAEDILAFRARVFERGRTSPSSWHPLVDGCPDYHRLHDNYPQAHVKQKMHGFYHHGYSAENAALFEYFRDIFTLKNHLAGLPPEHFVHQVPSDGVVARVNVQHYPRGGGYQAEHVDPVGPHAHIQTLVVASQCGRDFLTGGVFARPHVDLERRFLDEGTRPGDLLVFSPSIPHGVAPIDPDVPYSPDTNDGRWMVLPVMVGSDDPRAFSAKPVQVGPAL